MSISSVNFGNDAWKQESLRGDFVPSLEANIQQLLSSEEIRNHPEDCGSFLDILQQDLQYAQQIPNKDAAKLKTMQDQLRSFSEAVKTGDFKKLSLPKPTPAPTRPVTTLPPLSTSTTPSQKESSSGLWNTIKSIGKSLFTMPLKTLGGLFSMFTGSSQDKTSKK